MLISGEPDPSTASLEDWVAYREHLRVLPVRDETVSVALAIANAQIQKLRTAADEHIAARVG
tara:strand:- start:38 stop:223 length:186 start_codon:yes stop_codon:yes gene_type:complete